MLIPYPKGVRCSLDHILGVEYNPGSSRQLTPFIVATNVPKVGDELVLLTEVQGHHIVVPANLTFPSRVRYVYLYYFLTSA
jgi:hypothetical protein